MRKEIAFTKDEMIQLLVDWTNALYEDNPPKSIFDDNCQFVGDFVEGYFKAHFQPERLTPEERNLAEDLGVFKIKRSPISMDYFTLCDSPNTENK